MRPKDDKLPLCGFFFFGPTCELGLQTCVLGASLTHPGWSRGEEGKEGPPASCHMLIYIPSQPALHVSCVVTASPVAYHRAQRFYLVKLEPK